MIIKVIFVRYSHEAQDNIEEKKSIQKDLSHITHPRSCYFF